MWSLDSENVGINLSITTSGVILEVTSTVKQVMIANILKTIAVLGTHLGALHGLTCLIFIASMRVSTTVNHILQRKLKQRDPKYLQDFQSGEPHSEWWNVDLNPSRLFSKLLLSATLCCLSVGL